MPGDPAPEPLIRIRQVIKEFHTPSGGFTALKDINLDFQAGEFASIVGKSGSGKSTLINMISGIDVPTRGSVTVMGAPIHQMEHSELAVWRGKNMGIIFQFFQLLPMLNVLENVMLPMDFCNSYPEEERETRARRLLEMVELAPFANLMPAELSGGQQQCAAIARALANDPPLIVADEPTGNLDSRTAEVVFDLMLSLESQGKTIIMVTHDPSLAAKTTRTILISDGEIIPDALARAFPALPHEELLWLSHHLTSQELQPGELVFSDTNEAPGLAIIENGRLASIPSGHQGANSSPAVLERGAVLSRGERDLGAFRRLWQAAPGSTAQLLILPLAGWLEWQKRFPGTTELFPSTSSGIAAGSADDPQEDGKR